DWHNTGCRNNLLTGIVNADDDSGTGGHPPGQIDTGSICPIGGFGMDARTEAVDDWNETEPPVFNFLANMDGVRSLPAARTFGVSIADQLVNAGLSWKSYQESLPVAGADGIGSSNGTATDLTTFDATRPVSPANLPGTPTSPVSGVVAAYAVKHNPFAYFASVQNGRERGLSLDQVVGFDGKGGLYSDLATGHVPSYAFIAPNQCNDQHGRGNGDAFCQYDPGVAAYGGLTNGAQLGLNPGLSAQADTAIKRIVTSITSSPVWRWGNNAIVIVWDENDYSGLAAAPTAKAGFADGNLNRVVLTVQLSYADGSKAVHSQNFYNSFSLLKSIEAGFGLPCLNHACDKDVAVMSDLFGARRW
ncbi:MAG TPA: alkaline phosphatase family protein, partial [Steroidobacteraceae bacterium]|nr:alkaline phosphatase family protein [Steroidobacteraceae bacterium]